MAEAQPEVVQEYTLQLGSPSRRTGRVVGHLSLNRDLLPGGDEAAGRLQDLNALIALRKAEEVAGVELLPADFPVFVAHIDSVRSVRGDPSVLTVTVNHDTMSRMTPGGRTAGVREICGAVASHMIEGPQAFPPEGPVGQPETPPVVPYWDKGRLQPGAPFPAGPLSSLPPVA